MAALSNSLSTLRLSRTLSSNITGSLLVFLVLMAILTPVQKCDAVPLRLSYDEKANVMAELTAELIIALPEFVALHQRLEGMHNFVY